ncbi:MAG: proton-conducting transporter membrane subunit, partial [Cyanobacteria bacterium J06648_10]
VAYDRTHTLSMEKMGGMAKAMPITFAFFTAGAMASLALPGMSGFVAEITIFLGIATSDAYNVFFKAGIVILAAIGVILTPIYLLSMLRRIFYGEESEVKIPEDKSWEIMPREAFVAVCLLVPIIGIGLYPKVAIQTYSDKTTEVAAQVITTLPDVPNAAPLSRVMSMPGAEQIIAPSL